MIAADPSMAPVLRAINLYCKASDPIIISGETGVGKELAANLIKEKSGIKKMVAVNCSAVADSLFQSEFFGHIRGAFTGAVTSKKGYLEQADHGILFLDEINSLPIIMQGALLRALETKEFYPVGCGQPRQVDFKLISATNMPLDLLVSEGVLRPDFFYRIAVLQIDIPPLRKRPKDLSEFISAKISPKKELTEGAKRLLFGYSYPGNFREASSICKNLEISTGSKINAVDVQAVLGRGSKQINFNLEEIEAQTIQEALKYSDGNKTEAAKLLGVPVRTLHNKLK